MIKQVRQATGIRVHRAKMAIKSAYALTTIMISWDSETHISPSRLEWHQGPPSDWIVQYVIRSGVGTMRLYLTNLTTGN